MPTREMLTVFQTVPDPHKVPTVRIYLSLVTARKLLKRLEGAIGIEPVNKGFAVLAKLFARDRTSVLTCVFINLLSILVLPAITQICSCCDW
jgi:hypothetical protein